MLAARLLFRTAARLRAGWECSSHAQSPARGRLLECLATDYRAPQAAKGRLVKATKNGLSLVLPTLEDELRSRIAGLQQTLTQLQHFLQDCPKEPPSMDSLIADLRQLEEEFTEVKIHSDQKAVSVTTHPIQLEGIDLGHFAIKFCWGRQRDGCGSDSFDIIALDPNPAGSDECVTHPHVKDENLCAGEASIPIRKALEQGRLADAFILVRSVLTTYNPRSAHVNLDAWNGEQCHDCGDYVSDDDVWSCDGCEHCFCGGCVEQCSGCPRYRCSSCMGRCSVCKRSFCDKCLRTSAHSSRKCCCSCSASCQHCRRLIVKDELDHGCQIGCFHADTTTSTENRYETENAVCAGAS